MSKLHQRRCLPGVNPCTDTHEYSCGSCGGGFVTDETTHYRVLSTGRVLPNKFWPTYSQACYSDTFSDANPNEISSEE